MWMAFDRTLCLRGVAALSLFTLLTTFAPGTVRAESEESGPSLNLLVHDTGVAFGNAPRVNGLRINFKDRYLERVNGLNLTLWSPSNGGDIGGEANGVALGLVGPVAARVNGIQAGLVAVVSSERLFGISAGGLAVVTEGERLGLAFGGLAVVSEGTSTGIGAGGLAVVSEGNLNGLHVAGLATVGEQIQGLSIGGLAVASGEETQGIALAGFATGAGDLRGLAIAPYNRYEGVQRGITIGLFNWAGELQGVQIGLMNRADNNPPPFRWLPLVNAHF